MKFKFNKQRPIDPYIIKKAKQDKMIMPVYEYIQLRALLDKERNLTAKLPLLYVVIFFTIQIINKYLSENEIVWYLIILTVPLFILFIYLTITRNYKFFLNLHLGIFAEANEELYQHEIKDEIDGMIDEIEKR